MGEAQSAASIVLVDTERLRSGRPHQRTRDARPSPLPFLIAQRHAYLADLMFRKKTHSMEGYWTAPTTMPHSVRRSARARSLQPRVVRTSCDSSSKWQSVQVQQRQQQHRALTRQNKRGLAAVGVREYHSAPATHRPGPVICELPIVEVVSHKPMKVHVHFEQPSKEVTQLPPGTRLHLLEIRCTPSGVQRMRVALSSSSKPLGWVTSRRSRLGCVLVRTLNAARAIDHPFSNIPHSHFAGAATTGGSPQLGSHRDSELGLSSRAALNSVRQAWPVVIGQVIASATTSARAHLNSGLQKVPWDLLHGGEPYGGHSPTSGAGCMWASPAFDDASCRRGVSIDLGDSPQVPKSGDGPLVPKSGDGPRVPKSGDGGQPPGPATREQGAGSSGASGRAGGGEQGAGGSGAPGGTAAREQGAGGSGASARELGAGAREPGDSRTPGPKQDVVPGEKLSSTASHHAVEAAANACMALRLDTSSELQVEADQLLAKAEEAERPPDSTSLSVQTGELLHAQKVKTDLRLDATATPPNPNPRNPNPLTLSYPTPGQDR